MREAANVMRTLLGREAGNTETPKNLQLLSKGVGMNAEQAMVPFGEIRDGFWRSDDNKEGIPVKKVGEGEGGQIYRGGRDIYKRVEGLYADIYREALIGGFLAKDKVLGNNICKILKIYKEHDANVYYYKMELVETTLFEYLEQQPQVHTKFIGTILIEISRILQYFHKRYRFKHNDLHPENIMLNIVGGKREYKFIDFSSSFIEINGIEYGTNDDNKYDLLTLVAIIYLSARQGPARFTEHSKDKLLRCMGDGDFNIFTSAEAGENTRNVNEKFKSSKVLLQRFTNYDKFVEYWASLSGGKRKTKRKCKRCAVKRRQTHRGPQ